MTGLISIKQLFEHLKDYHSLKFVPQTDYKKRLPQNQESVLETMDAVISWLMLDEEEPRDRTVGLVIPEGLIVIDLDTGKDYPFLMVRLGPAGLYQPSLTPHNAHFFFRVDDSHPCLQLTSKNTITYGGLPVEVFKPGQIITIYSSEFIGELLPLPTCHFFSPFISNLPLNKLLPKSPLNFVDAEGFIPKGLRHNVIRDWVQLTGVKAIVLWHVWCGQITPDEEKECQQIQEWCQLHPITYSSEESPADPDLQPEADPEDAKFSKRTRSHINAAKAFVKKHPIYAWDMLEESWFQRAEPGVWRTIDDSSMIHLVYTFLDQTKRTNLLDELQIKRVIFHIKQQVANLEPEPNAILFNNGIYDIETRTFKATKEIKDMFRWHIDCDYEPELELTPVIQGWLEQLSGMSETGTEIIRLFFAQVLGLGALLNCIFMVTGDAGTGKTTLFNFTTQLLGSTNVLSLSPNTLSVWTEANTFKKQLVCFSDLPPEAWESKRFITLIKRLTGRDTITGDVKYKQVKTGQFLGAVLIIGNYSVTYTSDPGIRRRMLAVYPRLIKKDINLNLVRDLYKDRAHLISWVLRISQAMLLDPWKELNLSAKDTMQDPLVDFIAKYVRFHINVRVNNAVIFERYRSFMLDEGYVEREVLSRTKFLSSFESLIRKIALEEGRKVERYRTNKERGMEGITLLSETETSELEAIPVEATEETANETIPVEATDETVDETIPVEASELESVTLKSSEFESVELETKTEAYIYDTESRLPDMETSKEVDVPDTAHPLPDMASNTEEVEENEKEGLEKGNTVCEDIPSTDQEHTTNMPNITLAPLLTNSPIDAELINNVANKFEESLKLWQSEVKDWFTKPWEEVKFHPCSKHYINHNLANKYRLVVLGAGELILPLNSVLESTGSFIWTLTLRFSTIERTKWARAKREYTHALPSAYTQTDDYCRITSTHPNFLNIPKGFKEQYLQGLSEKTKLLFYTFDLSASHLRLSLGFGQPMPIIAEALKQDKIWDYIIETAGEQKAPEFNKALIKKVVYTQLNGGKITNYKNSIGALYPDKFNKDEFKEWQIQIQQNINNFSAFKELEKLNQYVAKMGSKGTLYSPFDSRPISTTIKIKDQVKPRPKHTYLSRAITSMEMVIVLKLLHLLILEGTIMVSWEHDGIIVACLDPITEAQIDKVQSQLNTFCTNYIGLNNMPITVTQLKSINKFFI